jgi:hypothetical protein
MSSIKRVKSLLDISDNKMSDVIISLYSITEEKFQHFVKQEIKKPSQKYVYDFTSEMEIMTHIVYKDAPKCSYQNAVIYANKYIDKYGDNYIPIKLISLINFLNQDYHNDIYNEYLEFINTTDYIIALKILQQTFIAHIILVNTNIAYNDTSFANNIYKLIIKLCNNETKYNFTDKYSGVVYPYEYMQWIYKVKFMDLTDGEEKNKVMHEERYRCATVSIGLIEYILEYLQKQNDVIVYK